MVKFLRSLKRRAGASALVLLALWGGKASAQTYCTPDAFYGSCCDIGIGYVEFGTIANSSGVGTGTVYEDFTSLPPAIVVPGTTQDITIDYATPSTWDARDGNVWIDWNNNGTFEATEATAAPTRINGSTTFSITIPNIGGAIQVGPKRMRIAARGDWIGGGWDPCFLNFAEGEFEDYTIILASSTGLDIAAFSIKPTMGFVVGANPVDFSVVSVAPDAIESFDMGYQLSGSGVVSESVASVTAIKGSPLAIGEMLTLPFTTPLNIPAEGFYTLKVWSRNVNGGMTQNYNSNDTLTLEICTALDGTYTVGSGGDFATIQAAVDALQRCGVVAPVTINIQPGVYNEQVQIGMIPGADFFNTVTFDGGDTSLVTMTYDANSSKKYTLKLSDASFLIFRNIYFEGTDEDNAFVVQLEKSSDFNLFSNCVMSATSTNTGVDDVAPLAINGNSIYDPSKSDYNTFELCRFNGGGYVTVNIYGDYNEPMYGNMFESCNFTEVFETALRSNTARETRIYSSNIWFSGRSSGGGSKVQFSNESDNAEMINNNIYAEGDGIYVTYSSSLRFWNNSIVADGNGIYVDGGRDFDIVNNAIEAQRDGISLQYDASNHRIYHNTIVSNGSSCIYFLYNTWGGSASSNDVMNNILLNTNSSYTIDAQDAGSINMMDYNNMVTSGPDFARLGSDFSSLGALKAGDPGRNQHSVSVIPSFVGPGDYHLDPTVAPQCGRDIGGGYSDFDRDGDGRCLIAPSMGAYESDYVWPTPTPGFSNSYATVTTGSVDTIWINSPFMLKNVYPEGSPVRHEWDIHADGSVEGYTDNFEYVFDTPGWDSVRVTTYNCSGSASVVRYVYVDTPALAPNPEFVSDRYLINNGETVFLTDMTEFGPETWEWTVTPSMGVTIYDDQFDRTPEIYFENGGEYEICLKVTNARGTSSICKKAYIRVNTMAAMCSFPTAVSSNYGTLMDNGYDGDYSDSWDYNSFINNIPNNCDFLIEPCADTVKFELLSFALQPTYTAYGPGHAGDSVIIFDGNTADYSKLLGSYGFGASSWAGKQHIAPSGSMLVRFRRNKDGGYEGPGAGFVGSWTASGFTGMAKPVLTLEAPDTVYNGIEFVVGVHNSSPKAAYYWGDLDGDATYLEADGTQDVEYFSTIMGSGPVEIWMSTMTCGGFDTVRKTIEVVVPTTPPIIDFEADITTATTTDTVTLVQKTRLGAYDFLWNISPADYTIVEGSQNSDRIRVVFHSTGTYDVNLEATNEAGTDNYTKPAYIEVIDYCMPNAVRRNIDIGISKVTLPTSNGGINNSSDQGVKSYNDFTGTAPAMLEIGQSYTVTVERKDPALNDMNRKIWIDWNKDGQFDPVSELIGAEGAGRNISFSQSFSIPASATVGSTRMRIGASFKNQPIEACGSFDMAEFEDYRIFIREDQTKPVLTLLGKNPDSTEVGAVYVDPGATALDNIDGNLTDSIKVVSTVTTGAPGIHTITYTVTDSKGNRIQKVRRVIVTPDRTIPVITMFGSDTTVNVGDAYTDAGASAYDITDGNLTSAINTNNSVNTAVLGSYTVTYDVTDAAGHPAAQVVRHVTVADVEAPVLTLNGNPVETLEVNTPYTDAGADASDNYDPLASLIVNATPFENDSVGTFIVTFDVTDSSGNAAISVSRTIVVMDRTKPVIDLNGDSVITIEVGGVYIDQGETVTDNYCKGLTALKTGSVNTSVVGDYTITYNVTDCQGNVAATVTRKIKVVDTQRPVITMLGLPGMTLQRWDTYTEPGVTLSDNYNSDTEMRPFLTTGGNLDTQLPGLYVVTYDVHDASGNNAIQAVRSVLVVERYLGVEGKELEAGIQVYPNPTTGLVSIVSGLDKEVSISVISAYGQTIAEGLKLNNGQAQVDLSGFAAGTYMIRIQMEGQVVTKSVTLVK